MDTARLKELAQSHAEIDYANSASVTRGNAAADEIGKMIRMHASSKGVQNLLELLPDPEVGPWVAYTLAEAPALTETQRGKCIARIKEIALAGGLDASAARLWLMLRGYVS